MKAVKRTQNIILVAILGLVFSIGVIAQDEDDKILKYEPVKIARVDKKADLKMDSDKNVSSIGKNDLKSEDDETKEAKKAEQYYANYLQEYRLGPQDIISCLLYTSPSPRD